MTDHRLIRLSQVTLQRRQYLWKDRIPLGGLTILDGDPGSGKSGITYDITARVTTGQPMPFCEAGIEPSGVILLQAEDSLGCDVLPNLRAAGANTDSVIAYDRSTAPLTFPSDIGVIESAITEVDAKFVVIDPISSFLGVSLNHDQSVRKALQPLAELSERLNIAVVLVRHLTKGGRGGALYRGAGSIAIIGVARSGLVVGDDPACNEKHQHVLAQSKGNQASAESIAYRTELNPDKSISVRWLGPSNCTANEVLVSAQKFERSALTEAIEFLSEVLSEGPLPAKEVLDLGKDAGVSKRTLVRAKAQLDVVSKKIGGGPRAAWVWELPDGIDRLMDTLIHGPAAPGPRRDIVRRG